MAARTLFAIAVFASAHFAIACATDGPLGSVEFTANPPVLNRIPRERIQSSMWALAAEVDALDRLLNESEGGNSVSRHEVDATLERMKIAARSIDQPRRTSQHPVLNRYLPRFIERLEHAQRATRRDPPNYYMASTIPGACLICHAGAQTAAISRP